MSAKSVAGAFAPCEKAMKTFPKLNVSYKGVLQTGFAPKMSHKGPTGFSVANFTDTVTILGSQLTPGGVVYEELRRADVS
jgi:hypothetical protein